MTKITPRWMFDQPKTYYDNIQVNDSYVLCQISHEGKHTLTLINSDTGDIIWEVSLPWIQQQFMDGSVITSVDYGGMDDPYLTLLNMKTGKSIWKVKSARTYPQFIKNNYLLCFSYLYSNPMIVEYININTGHSQESQTFTGDGDRLIPIDADRVITVEGNTIRLWRRSDGGISDFVAEEILSDSRKLGSVNVVKTSLYLSFESVDDVYEVISVNIETRQLNWAIKSSYKSDFLCVEESRVFFAEYLYDKVDTTVANPRRIVCRSRENGEALWRTYGPGEFCAAMCGDDTLAIVSWERYLLNTMFIDVYDGYERFRFQRVCNPSDIVRGSTALSLGKLCVVSNISSLCAFDVRCYWRVQYGRFLTGPIQRHRTVVAATAHGRIVAVDLDTGQEKWTKEVHQQLVAPLAVTVQVYAAHAQFVTVLDLATGGAVGNDIDAQSEVTTVAAIGDQFAVYATSDQHVYCVDGVSPKWSMQTVGVASAFAFEDDRLYVGDDAGIIYALNAKGEEAWRQPLFQRSIRCLLAVHGSVIYGDVNGNIACLAGTNGATLWSVTTTAKAPCTTMSVVSNDEDHILICDATGRVYKLNIGKSEFIWEKDVVGADRSAPVVTDRFVYAGTNAGTVAVLDLGTGELVRNIDLGAGAQTFVAPHIDAVLVTDDAGFLQALIP